MQGMTGFGRLEASLGAWSWAVEARSVNGRNLEVRFRGPAGFDGLERIAREAGLKVGGALYSDALSAPGTAADTYVHLFEHNVRTLVEAMTPAGTQHAH